MRTKLFSAFLLVIFVALISNIIFKEHIMKDFDGYIKGVKEDRLYWAIASIEGSYDNGRWNMHSLANSIHWGMMDGLELRVNDMEGNEIINSLQCSKGRTCEVMDTLSPEMRQKMESLIDIHATEGEFEKHPLYVAGAEIGVLYVRPLKSGGSIKEKENIFKKRGESFMIASFLIAGISALAMALFFSLYLSRPVRRLKLAAEKVAEGDFNIRVKAASKDEMGKLSESFNYMAEALQKGESLRKHLTSNIAHELRTPLAVMKTQLEAMADGIVTNTQEGFENIKHEVERLTRLVEGIEDITKAEASFFSKGEYAAINLKDFFKDIEYAMEPLFHEKGLVITVTDRGYLNVTTDVDKLERIVKNILSNSLKYTERGGAWIDYGREGTGFFIELRDSGIGIPEEEMPNIFLRFYRGKEAIDKGGGIGLAIVKELINIMGGKINASSEVGKGTSFRIWLPIK